MKCPICSQENTGALQIHLDLFHRRKELIRHIVGDQSLIAALRSNLAALQSDLEGVKVERNNAEKDFADLSRMRVDQAGEILRLRSALETRDGEQARALQERETVIAQMQTVIRAQDEQIAALQRDFDNTDRAGLAAESTIRDQAGEILRLRGALERGALGAHPNAGEGEPIRLQCPDCGIWYDLALGHTCEETGAQAPPVQSIAVGGASLDMLNALAWYIRNATQPDGDPGWNYYEYIGSVTVATYGPAHKLLIALDSYIKATNGGK
jgi:uncharacterized coiled-coil protein SlyX